MYSVKVSMAGQTFALSAANDSGGKKSRIRLSKEKRKTMIESFIKRYQSTNNGSFPSLNLTHKEVGGSFYTVREIVREIIQENRVLGPGQFSSEGGENGDLMTVNYPLGSIEKVSTWNDEDINETMLPKSAFNGHFIKQFDLDVGQYSTEERTGETGEVEDRLSVYEKLTNSEHSEEANLEAPLDSNGKYVTVNEAGVRFANHMQSNVASEELSKLVVEVDEELEKPGSLQGKVALPTEELQVETFPLRPEIDLDDDPGSSSTDLEAREVKLSDCTIVWNEASSIGSSSDLVTTKATDSSDVSGDSGGSPDFMTQDAEVNNTVNQHGKVNPTNDLEDISYSLPIKGDIIFPYNGVNQLSPHDNTTSKTTEQITLENASKAAALSESSNVTSNSVKEPTVASDYDFKRDDKARVGSSPPLDRIDLGSWKASKQETNPLLAFFKAFVDAFVKFWSE